MATSTTTPRAGLPQWKAEDKVKFITDVSKAFADVDKSFALSGDAFIPCTATYDSATKRHTLTPTQASITLPEVFTVRFIATASFTAGDKIYIGGKEYTLAYTDGTQEVQTGAWVLDTAVGITCVKTVAKAFVGAGSISQFAKIDEAVKSLKDAKAPLASPAFTGGATIGGKEIPTSESGTWTPVLVNTEGVNPIYTASNIDAGFEIIGELIHVWATIKGITITDAGTGWTAIVGLPRIPGGYSTSLIEHYAILKKPNGTDYDAYTGAATYVRKGYNLLSITSVSLSTAAQWKAASGGSLSLDITYRF